MKNFAKSILNYFAAYNETRFRFSRKLPYEWSEDSFTLDLAVFPEFQMLLLNAIAQEAPFSLEISKGGYTVPLESDALKEAMLEDLESTLNQDYLENSINQIREKLEESFPEVEPAELSEKALSEGFREFNLAFRKQALAVFTSVQDQKIREIKAELGFSSVPPSSFNPQREVQKIYDDLQNLSRKKTGPDGYIEEVMSYIQDQLFDFVIFDLHPVLRTFNQLIGTQSLYVFFHEIAKENQKYPVFSVEIEFQDGDRTVVLKSVRNVIMLNTPAINNFEFDTVLTTPRACRYGDVMPTLSAIERFLQAKYNVTESFLLANHFRSLIKDGLPTVRYRIGLQAVKEEDRRILDYSELITNLEEGAGRKFTDMIARYVDGNVENTADEVQETYTRSFPRKSVERLISKTTTVPLSLNETQKKILTAVEKGKNEIIVVDGPPGTGKSYAITAIVYLANQLGKSVVVTSHKKQALDVIDQSLTEQFKTLHPRSKPSVLRLEKPRGPSSLNNLQNTLSNPVINAARNRSQQMNQEAVTRDRERLYNRIENENRLFWDTTGRQDEMLRKTFEWARELEATLGYLPDETDQLPSQLPEGITLDTGKIREIAGKMQTAPLSISLDALQALFRDQEKLPDILAQCDRLNKVGASLPAGVLDKVSAVPPNLRGFREIIDELTQCLRPDIVLREFMVDDLVLESPGNFSEFPVSPHERLLNLKARLAALVDLEGKLLGKLLKTKEINQIKQVLELDFPEIRDKLRQEGSRAVLNGAEEIATHVEETRNKYPFLLADYILDGFHHNSPESLKAKLERLGNLEFHPIIILMSSLLGKSLSESTFSEIKEKLELLAAVEDYLELRETVEKFAAHVGMSIEDLPRLYATLKQIYDFIGIIEKDEIDALALLFRFFAPVLESVGIDASDLSSLGGFAADHARAEHLFRLIELHSELSSKPSTTLPERGQLAEYLTKARKLLEYQTDRRLSNLLNHTADVQRIQTAIEAGKRITTGQARILLSNLSCIISEPGLISQHFPMEADLIDLLVIDEASQVSIAESISLMLRARQTIVFGDELQYGAVGAITVSQRYSEHYFKDILRDYALDQNQAISDEERDRLAREVSETPDEDAEESSLFIPVAPGTREWLKTFSVRTSTLAFAKALSNYSESLNVHFRSFPEIISYSNDFFYRESQIELITNRIRTKPIKEVLRFIKVDTKGLSGRNVNLDEIEAIQRDLEEAIKKGYEGTIGVICSFREQAARMEEIFRKELRIYSDLVRNHRFTIWFVGDVQGEERDLIYYSFVQDKKIDNADLRTIYPIIGGTADNIRRLKMQRLNVGFSRAKDIMVFVNSMPIGDYSDTRLGDALRHYEKVLDSAQDLYVEDESIFDSPAEKELYGLILQTPFFKENQEKLRLIAQFEIGKYIREEYHRNIPKYRVDFLLTKTDGGKEKSLIIEYDGVEFHTQNPDIVTKHNFDQEYLEYDTERQLELESYGYSFLRINKFSLLPQGEFKTRVDVLNHLLDKRLKN